MTDTTTILTKELNFATHALGRGLATSEPFTRYVQAQAAMAADPSASDLLDLLISMQNDFRHKQGQGNISQGDIDQLKAFQERVQDNSTIMEYANSQKAAIAFLKETNQEISQQLGMDFALIAKRSCG
jgi:cell fate (sporulation/competence/biofilm development) regulator YlbF (YheA/YmcA/DUF963 family)